MSIPISLYIHTPWCLKKCPYCDFNSHVARQKIPENAYLNALISDFHQQLFYLQNRQIETIFIGGGTPSLLSPEFYQALLTEISPYLKPDAEITLEANPGTIDFNSDKFARYRELGINRLSLGVQSLQSQKLKYLGRMHSSEDAIQAIAYAKAAGFDNFNCDLMFGLPDQSIDDALEDLQGIIDHAPTHLSWYQLTIEPNTHFYRRPPTLPESDYIFDMQEQGQALLAQQGYQQYEVSAYAKENKRCQHNLNYWLFGDYIGIGAGAHGKITNLNNGIITRTEHHKNPTLYQTAKHKQITTREIPTAEVPFEFMLNALRLYQPIDFELFEKRTQIPKNEIIPILQSANEHQLLNLTEKQFALTQKGKRFVDDIVALFVCNRPT